MKPRCHCRPGCLAPLRPTDTTIATRDGWALSVHLQPSVAYPVDGLTSLSSPLSKVAAP